MKHTPGPWHTNKPVESNGYVWVNPIDGVCGEIATAWPITTNGEAEANARLIAAAPDLLNSAVMALECLRQRGLDSGQVGASLEIAIAKATGEEA